MSLRTSPRLRLSAAPSLIVEVLRFCVVLFGAAGGFEIAAHLAPTALRVLGPFDAVTTGLIVGAGLGYALGGVLARWAVAAVSRTESSLRERPAEELLSGAVGAVVGLLAGSAFAWPLFLVTWQAMALPTFVFVAIVTAMLGYRVGTIRSESVLRLIAGRAGIVPRGGSASALPKIVDGSVLMDGRIVDVVRAGFLHGRMIVPTAVLSALHETADHAEEVHRTAGRRGIETLETLRGERGVTLEVTDDLAAVDQPSAALIRTCLDRDAALLTVDRGLARAAAVAGVRVLDLGALALALRPPVVAGDEVEVALLRPGKEPGQAVGYLDDGSMVVVERARGQVGRAVAVLVTSVLTTASGRMVFGKAMGSISSLADDDDRRPMPAVPAQAVPSPAVFARPVESGAST